MERSRSKTRSAHEGFTLVELLVVLGILSLVTGILVLILNQVTAIPRWGNAQLGVNADQRLVGLWLIRDGNESRSFALSGACGSFETETGRTYTYSRAGTQLVRTDSASGQTQVLARHVTGVTCSVNDRLVTVELDLGEGEVATRATWTLALRVDP